MGSTTSDMIRAVSNARDDVDHVKTITESIVTDLEKLRGTFDEIGAALTVAVEEAETIPVETVDDYEAAAEKLLKLREVKKMIGERIDGLVKTCNGAHRSAKGIESTLVDPIDKLAGTLKLKMCRLVAREWLRAAGKPEESYVDAKKVAKAFELAEEGKQEEAEALLAEAGYLTPAELPDSLPKIKGISIRTTWAYTIDEESKIPRKFMQPNKTMISQTCRAMKDKTKIAGVSAYPKPTMAVGASK